MAASLIVEARTAREFENDLAAASWPAIKLARALGCTPDEAGDAVQEAALQAWRYRHTRKGPFLPWFLAIVRHTAARQHRRWLTLPEIWHPAPARAGDWPADDPSPELAQALRSLNPRQRAALWLRYGEDMSTASVAQVLGINESAAKQLLARARDSLRSRLEAAEAAGALGS